MATMFEGRTLLILKNQEINESEFNNLVKLNESSYGNKFVEFDSISNAKLEYDRLTASNIKCKYSNYYLFVRFSLEKNQDKDELVNRISTELTSKFDDLNILNINLYEKDNKMLGFGQIVLDRLDDIKQVLADNKINLSDDNTVSFYKFNRAR